jgi:lysophospholipase L1-like esterase
MIKKILISLILIIGIFIKTVYAAPNINDKKYIFDNTTFIGDSITVGLQNYVRNNNVELLNNSKFVAKVGSSINYAKNNFLKRCNTENIFIMLGINDMKSKASIIIKNYKALINKTKEKYAVQNIYIISILPMTSKRESRNMNNEKIDEINLELRLFADQEGITYLDIASVFKDDNNNGHKKYYRDNYVHLNSAGYALFVQELENIFNSQIEELDSIDESENYIDQDSTLINNLLDYIYIILNYFQIKIDN